MQVLWITLAIFVFSIAVVIGLVVWSLKCFERIHDMPIIPDPTEEDFEELRAGDIIP
ncbi:MAG: hypothetical protein H6760_03710 [Candidatus Nomurabacteria bacterium]|nr:MAG: hypothetical protein H6760_03710 [Candidatus Nomurabacteria bacterium]